MKKIILILIASIIVIYLLGNLKPVHRLVLNYGNQYLEKNLELTFKVAKTNGNIFHHLILTDVAIGDVANIGTLEIGYSPLSLLTGRIKIGLLKIDNPVIDIDKIMQIESKEKKRESPSKKEPIQFDIASLVINSGTIKYRKREIPFALSLSYESNRLTITHLTIDLPNSKFISSGNYNPEGEIDLSYQFNLDLADLNLGDGKLSSTGVIGGRGASPTGHGDFSFSSLKIGKVTLNYRYEDRNLYFDQISIIGNEFQFVGNARYHMPENNLSILLKGSVSEQPLKIDANYKQNKIKILMASNNWDVQISGTIKEEIDLILVGNYRNQRIQGKITYNEGNIDGMVKAPNLPISEQLSLQKMGVDFHLKFVDDERTGTVNITIDNIDYSHNQLGELTATIKLKENEIFISLTGFIKAQGKLGLKLPHPLQFNFSLTDFALDSFLEAQSGELNLAGKISGELSGSSGAKLSVTINHLLSNIDGSEISITEPARIDYMQSGVKIHPGTIYINNSEIQIKGIIAKELNFHLLTHAFDLRNLNFLLPTQIITGKLDADIIISGSVSYPRYRGKVAVNNLAIPVQKDTVGPVNINLELDKDSVSIHNLDIKYSHYNISNQGRIVFVIEGKQVQIKESIIKFEDDLVSFKGSIPISSDSGLFLNITTDSVTIAPFSSLLPNIELSGLISLSVDLQGALSQPEITGYVLIDSLSVITEKDTIGPVAGHIEFKKDVAQFKNLTVNYRQGKVVIGGHLGFQGRGKLSISIARLKIPLMEKSQLELAGNLRLSGCIDSSIVQGEILLNGSYLEPIEAQLIKGIINRANRPTQQPPEFLEKIDLDLGLNTSFAIKNAVADLNLHGDLQISGTAAVPGLTGRINIEPGGRIGYLSRDFRIERGIIDLVDPIKISPIVDIIAQTSINYQEIDYNITLSITGPPEKIIVNLTSDPELPRQEIVALLLTGKTRGIAKLPTAQQVGEKAIEYLINTIKEDIEKRTARALGLEKITVTGPVSKPESLRIGIEKRFQKRVKVSYSTGFEDWEQQRVGLDYDINQNLSIYSTYDVENRDAGAGFDLHLKLW